MKGAVGVIAGTWCAVVIACSAGAKRAPVMPQATQQPHDAVRLPRPNSPQADQIDQLAAQIDQERATIGLPEQQVISSHAATTQMTQGGTVPTAPPHVCRLDPSEKCKQTCTLSQSICDNAKKICAIASELSGDAWADQKCADGNATCDAAKKQCCDCTP